MALLPGEVEIKLVIYDREIVRIEPMSSDVEVTALSATDHKDLKRSPYGLRAVETIYETQVTQSVPKCFIVIGGYKVQVPCS